MSVFSVIKNSEKSANLKLLFITILEEAVEEEVRFNKFVERNLFNRKRKTWKKRKRQRQR